jgi:hypothetical protein
MIAVPTAPLAVKAEIPHVLADLDAKSRVDADTLEWAPVSWVMNAWRITRTGATVDLTFEDSVYVERDPLPPRRDRQRYLVSGDLFLSAVCVCSWHRWRLLSVA